MLISDFSPGVEGTCRGRLLLLLHQPHVRHQVLLDSDLTLTSTLSRDFFIKTLDDSASGIQGVMARLRERLEEVDHVSANVLDDQVPQCTTYVKEFRIKESFTLLHAGHQDAIFRIPLAVPPLVPGRPVPSSSGGLYSTGFSGV